MRHIIYLLMIFMLACPATGLAQAQDAEPSPSPFTVICSENVHSFTPLWGSWVLYSAGTDEGNQATLVLVNAENGISTPWAHDWDPQTDGWAGYCYEPVLEMQSSPNGQWVALMQGVRLPDGLVPEEYPGMSCCEVVLLCQADGSRAVPVTLTIMVGGGPRFDFTTDGRRVVGSPFLDCIPDAAHYAEFLSRDPDTEPPLRFNQYCISTGVREYLPGIDTGDGYWKCPYSDNFRIENNWYDEYRFGNFSMGGLIGEYTIPGDNPQGRAFGWVLPGAMLIDSANGSGLVHVDGRYTPAPAGDWVCYCWLPDGSYLFSDDGGTTIMHGKVDWTTFTIDWYVEHPELQEYSHYDFVPVRDSAGVLIHGWDQGELLYLPLSKAGAKP